MFPRLVAVALMSAVALTGCVAAPPSAPPPTASGPTPEPTPTPPTLSEFLATWDEFDTFEVSGTGDSTFDLPAGLTNGMVTATHTGSSYFEVRLTDDAGENSGYPLVETRGAYTGVTSWGIGADDPTPDTKIRIVADGAWTFRLEPLANAPVLTPPLEGETDAVFQYDGAYVDDAVEWRVAHEGDRHFSFAQYYGDRDIELHINESVAGERTVFLEPGPSLFAVRAVTPWSIEG
jgi:hypothetical protein